MTSKNIKLLTALALSSISMIAVVTVANESSQTLAYGQTCEHVGNHYTLKSPTDTESGVKESWVCCKCHGHFLTYSEGTWAEGGVLQSVTKEDDRYIPSYGNVTEYTEYLKDMGFDNTKVSDDGTITVGKYDVRKGGTQIIIPEGVTKIDGRCFTSSSIEWIVFPSTLETISRNSVTSATNVTFYFVGDKLGSKYYFNCKDVYEHQGIEWDFVNGEPTSKL